MLSGCNFARPTEINCVLITHCIPLPQTNQLNPTYSSSTTLLFTTTTTFSSYSPSLRFLFTLTRVIPLLSSPPFPSSPHILPKLKLYACPLGQSICFFVCVCVFASLRVSLCALNSNNESQGLIPTLVRYLNIIIHAVPGNATRRSRGCMEDSITTNTRKILTSNNTLTHYVLKYPTHTSKTEQSLKRSTYF